MFRLLDRLASKHFVAILLVTVCFTAFSLSLQAYIYYTQGVEARDQILQSVENSYLAPTAAAVFYFETDQLQLISEGILRLPYIDSLTIYEYVLEEYRPLLLENADSRSNESFDFPLVYLYEGESRHIGKLTVYSSLNAVRTQIIENLRRTAVLNIFTVLGMAVIILWLTNRNITKRMKGEETLRQSDERFRIAQDMSPDGFTILQPVRDTQNRVIDFIWVYENDSIARLNGTDPQKVVGQRLLELFPEHRDSQFMKAYQQVAESGKTVTFEDGYSSESMQKQSWFRIVVVPMAENIAILAQDITERKRMELQLVHDNILLKTQQEASPDGILIVDENDNIISFNQLFCKIWEIPDHIMAEQSSEKTMQYVLPRLIDPDEFVKRIRDLYKNKKASSSEEIALTNGKILARHSSPMFGPDAQYYGRVWFYRDITARKVAEEETKRFKTISDNAVYGKAIANLDGNLIYVNRFFAEIHGYSPDELIGKNLSIFHTANQLENVDKTNRTLRQDGYFSPCEVWHVHRNGTEFPMLMSGVLLKDNHGNPQYLAASAVDISERKQVQLALEQKNAELEQFVYSVSHDLKSPLVTVKTFAGMLRQDILNADPPQINDDLNYIDQAADKMEQLLDALLRYSRIGRIDTPAQTLPVDQQVQNCLDALAGILQQHQVQVSTSELPYQLHGSPMHFGQIWQNLIENAVKYMGGQPQPQIEIGSTRQGLDVVFYVRDNGMGIASEHNERIFNLFSQLHPGSDGSGLGLTLVKKIVSIYQGRIWVESAGAGQGSCFMFTLPGALVKDGSPT